MQISKFVGRSGLRDAAIAVAIAALVALSWSLVAGEGWSIAALVRKYYLYILAYSYLILLLPPIFAGRRLASVLSILGGLVLALFLAADLTALRFFGAPLFDLYFYLPVKAGNASPGALAGYAASYVPASVWLLAVATILLGLGAARVPRNRGRARMAILLLLPLSYLAATLSAATSAPRDPLIAAMTQESPKPLKQLVRSDRSGNVGQTGAPRAEPETIILVILESAGATTPSSDGKGLLRQKLVAESGTAGWVDFPNAVTNSNATNISVPSILTGAGAHEPAAKVHALPFLWQYATARGYRTAFLTSSTMRWGDFESFFADARVDQFSTGEDSGLRFINDLAVDDHYVYRTAADAIEKADGKLLLTLYPQSLHWPFQTSSAFGIPAHIKDARSRATYVAEAGFRTLFDALRKTGRLDDALIVVVGDHGEFDYASSLRMPRMRMDTFDEGILSPLFLIKAPAGLDGAESDALAANAGKLVANLDIAPTFADLLGGEPGKGLGYSGYSLLRAVPDDRIVYSTSTNEWRQWTKSAIAVSRGQDRLTCNEAGLCRLNRAHGAKLIFRHPAGPEDELFRLAANNPALRQALGQIYRNHYSR